MTDKIKDGTNQIIRTLSQFVELSDDISSQLLDKLSSVKLIKKNEFFIHEGNYCDKIAFINKGMIRHFYNTEKGEITRWVSLENNFCTSFASFIKEIPSKENLQAITKTEVFLINKKDLFELLKVFPILNKVWTQLIEYHYLGMEERVFELIALNAEERYARLQKFSPEFILNVPDKYIASMLGIEPRHLSRIRSKK